MKIKILTALLVCFTYSANAQEVYFYTGKNFTNYDYKNSTGGKNSNLKEGNGNFFEVGVNKKIKQERFSYSVGIALNEFNNIGGNTVNNYQWSTQYLGIQSRLHYSYFKGKNYDFLSTIGLNGSTIIKGDQQINGVYYDLTKEKEFQGFLITPSIGLQFKYNLGNLGHVSLGYNYIKSYNLSNSTDQKLGFTTNQIQFGVHFAIKSNSQVLPDKLKGAPLAVDSLMVKAASKDKINALLPLDKSSLKVESKNDADKLNTIPVKNAELNTDNLKGIEKTEGNGTADESLSKKSTALNSNEFKKPTFYFSEKGMNITNVSSVLVQKTVKYMISNPNATLVLNGHASKDGVNVSNYLISLKRASTVKKYFIKKGIPENRIEVVGKGFTEPKFPNKTAVGRLKNKRVEIEFK